MLRLAKFVSLLVKSERAFEFRVGWAKQSTISNQWSKRGKVHNFMKGKEKKGTKEKAGEAISKSQMERQT